MKEPYNIELKHGIVKMKWLESQLDVLYFYFLEKSPLTVWIALWPLSEIDSGNWRNTCKLWQQDTIFNMEPTRYTFLLLSWNPLCLQNCFISLWHRFKKVLGTFLRNFGSHEHDNITQMLYICQLRIHNLPFHHIPNVLDWDLVTVSTVNS